MKIAFTTPKPRNPLVVHTLRRRAGSHRASGRTDRQQASRALQRELSAPRQSP